MTISGRRPAAVFSGIFDPGRLEIGVLLQGVPRLVSPEARQLDAAERDSHIPLLIAVNPHGPSPQCTRYPMRSAQISGPQAGSQTVRGIPCDSYGLRLVAYHLNGKYRPEDLLADDRVVWSRTGHHSRFEIGAARLS